MFIVSDFYNNLFPTTIPQLKAVVLRRINGVYEFSVTTARQLNIFHRGAGLKVGDSRNKESYETFCILPSIKHKCRSNVFKSIE